MFSLASQRTLGTIFSGLPTFSGSQQTYPRDEVAAHPSDKQKYGKGVTDHELVPPRAIKRFGEAVADLPHNAFCRGSLKDGCHHVAGRAGCRTHRQGQERFCIAGGYSENSSRSGIRAKAIFVPTFRSPLPVRPSCTAVFP